MSLQLYLLADLLQQYYVLPAYIAATTGQSHSALFDFDFVHSFGFSLSSLSPESARIVYQWLEKLHKTPLPDADLGDLDQYVFEDLVKMILRVPDGADATKPFVRACRVQFQGSGEKE